jgi:hypothetical protein
MLVVVQHLHIKFHWSKCAGNVATNADNSNFMVEKLVMVQQMHMGQILGNQVGFEQQVRFNSNFMGVNAGLATNAESSNFIGYVGHATSANFKLYWVSSWL